MDRRQLLLGIGGLGLAGTPAWAQYGPNVEQDARDAWIYGLPMIEMANSRARQKGLGLPFNMLAGGRGLADHTSRTVTTPNNDTLYLSGWADLRQGPVILTVPRMGQRYWSVAVMDMFSNNNAVLGSRTVGPDGGTFALIGPDHVRPESQFREPLPVRVATPCAWVLVRVLVDGPDDVAAVQGLLKGFKLSGKAGPPPGTVATREAEPGPYFGSVMQLLQQNRPPATDEAILRRCRYWLAFEPKSPVGDQAVFDAKVAAGVAEARKLVSGGWGRDKPVNGWSYPRASLGDYGQDYGYRAAVALAGLAALPRAEAIYLRPEGETDGLFHSDRLWRLRLPAEVPVEAFWSLSMYEATPDGQFFFTDNPMKRYAIGDRTPGLKRRPDGGVDLWIGRKDPGGERSANWLPAPKSGPYTVTWRGYLPKPSLLNGQWLMPAIVPA